MSIPEFGGRYATLKFESSSCVRKMLSEDPNTKDHLSRVSHDMPYLRDVRQQHIYRTAIVSGYHSAVLKTGTEETNEMQVFCIFKTTLWTLWKGDERLNSDGIPVDHPSMRSFMHSGTRTLRDLLEKPLYNSNDIRVNLAEGNSSTLAKANLPQVICYEPTSVNEPDGVATNVMFVETSVEVFSRNQL